MAEKKVNQYWLAGNGIISFSSAILASVALAFALHYTRGIMVPFVLSLFTYFILSPIRLFFLRKLKFPRSLSLLMTFLVVFLILFGTFLILSSAIQQFISGYSIYQAKVIYFADQIQDFLVNYGIPMENVNLSEIINGLPVMSLFKGAGAWALNLISTTGLVFIFLLFLFTGSPVKTEKEELEQTKNMGEVGREINLQISKYLSVKLFTSSITAAIVFVILSVFGLDLAFVFAFLTFILNFIPTVGSLIATALPIPVALLQYESSITVALVILIPGAVQFCIGSIMEPKMMGKSLNLHPITVLLSLMFWSLIWGVVGAFLAVPITAILKIVLNKIEGGKYITAWMSGSIEEPV